MRPLWAYHQMKTMLFASVALCRYGGFAAVESVSFVAHVSAPESKRTMYMSKHGSGGVGGVPQRFAGVPQWRVPPAADARLMRRTPPRSSAKRSWKSNAASPNAEPAMG